VKNQKQIESAIAEVKRQIAEKQKLQTIATFAGADVLLSLFQDAKEFYQLTLNNLDESNPTLNKEYAKNKICMKLVDSWIAGMTGAETALEELKKQFLALNEELGGIMKQRAIHDKNRM
jgi:hypothetical protein